MRHTVRAGRRRVYSLVAAGSLVVGGFIASALGVGSVTGLNIGSIIIAIIGACIVLFVVRAVQGRTASTV